MEEIMHINMEEKQEVTVCCISGEVDINSSPELKKYFEQITKRKPGKVIIDFADVTYVDSSGLATFVDILKKVRSYGGKLKLSGLSEKVKGLFEMTKLDKLFDIVADETAAISSF